MRYDKLTCFSADNAIHNNIDICNDLGCWRQVFEAALDNDGEAMSIEFISISGGKVVYGDARLNKTASETRVLMETRGGNTWFVKV